MAFCRLRELLNGTRQRVLWLEYDKYARQVFANAAADWWSQPTRYATTMIQARKAIKTEVVTLDIAAPGFAGSAPGSDPLATCKLALARPTGLAFISDCVDALAHQLSAQVDLVLRVPVPLDLLRQAGATEPGFDDLDEVSTAILATVRRCAEKPISGLLLTRTADSPLTEDETDAYAPLIHAARHYGWVSCIQCTESVVHTVDAELNDVDFFLCAELSLPQLRTLNAAETKFGGGLSRATWADQTEGAVQPGDHLLFGEVPADANPETVLARCAVLGTSL